MPLYVTLILPLALREAYHYSVDELTLSAYPKPEALIGCRAVVSFGRKAFNTGIIDSICDKLPEGIAPENIKPISYLLDEAPLVPPEQLQLWHWVADYYLCHIGQVLRTAMPGALLPESQTRLFLNENFCSEQALSELEYRILDTLRSAGAEGMKIELLRTRLGERINRAYTRLVELGAIYSEERVISRYRPRLKTYIELAPDYRSEEGIARAFEQLKRAKRQQDILTDFLRMLTEAELPLSGSIARERLSRGDSQRSTLIKKIAERGIWHLEERRESRILPPRATRYYPNEDAPTTPTELPQGVSYVDSSDLEAKEILILQLVRYHTERGEQVLLLSPSAHDAPSAEPYLRSLSEASRGRLYYYHPQTSEAKRTELYKHLAESEEPCLVIGTRTSVFLPMKRLALIIVEEEQEYMYKQQFVPPYFHARDVALYLGANRGIRVLMTSSSPSAETLFNVLRGKYHRLPLGGSQPVQLPPIQCIDIAQERRRRQMPPGTSISAPLHRAIEQVLHRGQRVLLLQNRRGYAPYTLCRACGEGIKCPHCDLSLSYYASERLLRCHYCDYISPLPSACPHCASTQVEERGQTKPALALLGYGVERVAEEVEEHYPEASVLRIDSDSLQSAKARLALHERLGAGDADIIVGTQLIKGQPLFENIGLIALVHLDAMLSFPDFRSSERAYQVLYQLMLRATRSQSQPPTQVIIQTSKPEQPFIARLREQDYLGFIKAELSERQMMHFPPFVRLSSIRFKGFDEALTEEIAQAFSLHLGQLLPKHAISHAHKPTIGRIDGQYIREVICRRPFQEPYREEREAMRSVETMLAQRHSHAYKRVQIHYNIDAL